MIGRCFKCVAAKRSIVSLVNQSVSCSFLAVIRNNELPLVEANQLERQKIIDELINKVDDDSFIYDKRLDADLSPFSTNVDLEYLDDLKPPLENTFNLAHYINRMPTLQRLVDLGVNLHVLEQNREIAQYLIRLDFERNIKDHLLFLKSIGLEDDELGVWITCNPLIFRESIDNLKIRLEYLKSKKFTQEMMEKLIRRYPPFLNFPIKRLDATLGCLQREFKLTGDDIRSIVSNHPKVVHFSQYRFKEIAFATKDIMQFSDYQVRKIVVGSPSVFYRGRVHLEKSFDILHWKNDYSKELIAETPHSLTTHINSLIYRINYLKSLGLFQPDPRKPCFTSLKNLCLTKIQDFVVKCSHTSVLDYSKYLKSF